MDVEDGLEKRQYKRFAHMEPVSFYFKDPTLFGGCLSCDLSEGGIRVRSSVFVPLETEMVLTIQLSADKTIECLGRVVWVEKNRFNDDYQLGLAFDMRRTCIHAPQEIRDCLMAG